jgi:hypothetical protein
MFIQADLKEDIVQDQVEQKLIKWLAIVDGAMIDGRMKVWISNFHICSKLAWLLMVQNWFNSTAKKWQKIIQRRYRSWLGLAKSAEPSILYSPKEHFGLQIKNLEQVQKQLRVVKWHILKTLKDDEAHKPYRYRFELDQQGHIGKGRDSSPCLNFENPEQARTIDAFFSGAQFDRKGLGFKRELQRKPNPRAELVGQLKKEAEAKRLVICIDMRCRRTG